ncbi:MAG TPA: DUF3426 domain-containing protein [Burkholderiales bacterium]|nr:DUF3426 domain-containing protein [Burkholderiales bacterium]
MQTVCPICHTIFRVAAAALHDTDGMVQCGVCGMVFNAHAHWIATTAPLAVAGEAVEVASSDTKSPEPPETASGGGSGQEKDILAGHSDETNAVAILHDNDTPDTPAGQPDAGSEPLAEPVRSEEPAVPYPEETDPLSDLSDAAFNESPHTDDAPSLHDAAAESGNEQRTDAVDVADDASSTPIGSAGSEQGSDTYIDFLPVRKERRPVLFTATSSILLFLLLLQFGYLYRNRIASDFPQSKPALMSLCQTFGCRIELPRSIEAIKISSSELITDPAHQNWMNVTFGLENLSNKTVAYPSVSLALINDAGEIVVKRNFDPPSYASKAAIARGISPHDEISGKLTLKLDRINVSNYKLLLYYS